MLSHQSYKSFSLLARPALTPKNIDRKVKVEEEAQPSLLQMPRQMAQQIVAPQVDDSPSTMSQIPVECLQNSKEIDSSEDTAPETLAKVSINQESLDTKIEEDYFKELIEVELALTGVRNGASCEYIGLILQKRALMGKIQEKKNILRSSVYQG